MGALDEFRVYWQSEIEVFSKAFFKPTKKQGNMDFGVLNSFPVRDLLVGVVYERLRNSAGSGIHPY